MQTDYSHKPAFPEFRATPTCNVIVSVKRGNQSRHARRAGLVSLNQRVSKLRRSLRANHGDKGATVLKALIAKHGVRIGLWEQDAADRRAIQRIEANQSLMLPALVTAE